MLFRLPAALGFTGESGSGDDDPTLDTADSRLDRLVLGVSFIATGTDAALLRVVRRRGVGGGSGATASCSSSASQSVSSSWSMSPPGMLRLRS